MNPYDANISLDEYALNFEKYSLNHCMMSAALFHHESKVIEAIKRGYPINAYDNIGHTLLGQCINMNELHIIKMLLEHGAEVNMRSGQFKEADKGTLMHVLVQTCHYNYKRLPDVKERFELLLKHGANPRIVNLKGQNVIAYIKYYIRVWHARKTCHCGIKFDRFSFIQSCQKHDMLRILNDLIDCILDFERKNKTLFELMLPQIKKYKPPSNKRRRTK